MNYYNEIKNKLIENEAYKKIKDHSKNRHDLTTYYCIGELLFKAGKNYGESIINEYSKRLTHELGKGYTPSRLRYIRRFYYVFSKCPTLSDELSYSHYCELIWIDDFNKINYYITKAVNQKLTIRQLRTSIKQKEYERLDDKTKHKLHNQEQLDIKDLIPNPILIRGDKEIISEKVLHNVILEDIESFMKELGNSFSFIGSEYKIIVSNTYNYIDLLLFNYEYNCFVVVELKVTELKKEHIGQIQIYMNYIDENLRKPYHDKTIGLIICKRNNEYIIEYSSDKRIIAREYETI